MKGFPQKKLWITFTLIRFGTGRSSRASTPMRKKFTKTTITLGKKKMNKYGA